LGTILRVGEEKLSQIDKIRLLELFCSRKSYLSEEQIFVGKKIDQINMKNVFV